MLSVFTPGKEGLAGRFARLTFSVVAEAHLGLAEANGVLAGADAIELLELCLVDALQASRQRSVLLESTPNFLERAKLTWLGTYSSMALMPTFWGLSDMMCGLCGGVFCVGEGRGVVACEYFFSRRCGVRGVARTIVAARWGFGIKEQGEVSPVDGEFVWDGDGEGRNRDQDRTEMVWETGLLE